MIKGILVLVILFFNVVFAREIDPQVLEKDTQFGLIAKWVKDVVSGKTPDETNTQIQGFENELIPYTVAKVLESGTTLQRQIYGYVIARSDSKIFVILPDKGRLNIFFGAIIPDETYLISDRTARFFLQPEVSDLAPHFQRAYEILNQADEGVSKSYRTENKIQISDSLKHVTVRIGNYVSTPLKVNPNITANQLRDLFLALWIATERLPKVQYSESGESLGKNTSADSSPNTCGAYLSPF